MRAAARKFLHSIGPLHRSLSRHRGTLIHLPRFHPPAATRLGSDYGGWTILPNLLGADSVVYSVGVGFDVTFDLAMIERFGCTVHAFDPTPRSRDWVAGQSLPEQFRFHLIGLADKDEEVAFALPPRTVSRPTACLKKARRAPSSTARCGGWKRSPATWGMTGSTCSRWISKGSNTA